RATTISGCSSTASSASISAACTGRCRARSTWTRWPASSGTRSGRSIRSTSSSPSATRPSRTSRSPPPSPASSRRSGRQRPWWPTKSPLPAQGRLFCRGDFGPRVQLASPRGGLRNDHERSTAALGGRVKTASVVETDTRARPTASLTHSKQGTTTMTISSLIGSRLLSGIAAFALTGSLVGGTAMAAQPDNPIREIRHEVRDQIETQRDEIKQLRAEFAAEYAKQSPDTAKLEQLQAAIDA